MKKTAGLVTAACLVTLALFVGCDTVLTPPAGPPGTLIRFDPAPPQPWCDWYFCCCWRAHYYVDGELLGICEYCDSSNLPVRVPYSVKPDDTVEVILCGAYLPFCELNVVCYVGTFQVTDTDEPVSVPLAPMDQEPA